MAPAKASGRHALNLGSLVERAQDLRDPKEHKEAQFKDQDDKTTSDSDLGEWDSPRRKRQRHKSAPPPTGIRSRAGDGHAPRDPPQVLVNSPPKFVRSERDIFVGQLSREVGVEQLKAFFRRFGGVADVHLFQKHFHPGHAPEVRSHFAYVSFDTPEAVAR